MAYQLLLGGYRKTFTQVSVDPASAKIKILSDSPAPEMASWLESTIEPLTTSSGARVIYGISEADPGKAYGLEVQDGKITMTQQRKTGGGSAHIHVMKDGSGVVAANYVGGTAVFFPTDPITHTLVAESESPTLTFDFTYENQKAPNPERQDTAHLHQIVEGSNGTLYMPDLGSDRIWIVKREGASGLKTHGYLTAPPGAGPRHVVISPDEKHLYCLTELSHKILAWSLNEDSQSTHPLPEFEVSIVPPTIPSSHSKLMDSAELCYTKKYPRTLFASNRLELQIFDKQPDLPSLPDYPPSGDAIAIVRLNEDGRGVKDVKHVRTGCNNVRGMMLSPDGKYAAVAGQDGGGLEIWTISGEDGEDWKLAAKDEKIEGVNTIVWL